MAKTPENSRIKRDRRHIISVLNTCYPSHMDGEEIYRHILDMNPEFTRVLLVRDMNYLHGKGYVSYRGKDGFDVRSISVKDCAFKLTPAGTDLGHEIIEDPSISI